MRASRTSSRISTWGNQPPGGGLVWRRYRTKALDAAFSSALSPQGDWDGAGGGPCLHVWREAGLVALVRSVFRHGASSTAIPWFLPVCRRCRGQGGVPHLFGFLLPRGDGELYRELGRDPSCDRGLDRSLVRRGLRLRLGLSLRRDRSRCLDGVRLSGRGRLVWGGSWLRTVATIVDTSLGERE